MQKVKKLIVKTAHQKENSIKKNFAVCEDQSQQKVHVNQLGKNTFAPGRKRRNQLKIVKKHKEKFVCCTRYGFVYDERKIKKEWLE